MQVRTGPGQLTGIIKQFQRLSKKPSSLETMALKLAPINELVTYCLKFPTQTRQAQRVATFLGAVMGDTKQEQDIQLVASMAMQSMMNHIRPVDLFAAKPIKQTRRWAMGSAPQRVHAEALVKALRGHSQAAQMRAYFVELAEKPEPGPIRKPVKLTGVQRRQQERQGGPVVDATEPKRGHKKFTKGALLAKKPEPVT